MSNNRNYGGSRYQPKGRNAELQGVMFKRTPIFSHAQVEKIQSSPFLNYNCKTGQSFLSDNSQSNQTDEKMSVQTLRQLIKEQLSKSQALEETNRKLIHTMQAQITDLKQRISEYEKENNQKIQESALSLKQNFREEAEKMGAEVEEEITTKLRSFFQKANIELKKDILSNVEEEFLTIGYGEDLENRLETINNKIELLSSGSSTTKKVSSEELQLQLQKASMAESFEPRIAKLQRQMQQSKKHQSDVVSRLKLLEEGGQERSQRVGEISERLQTVREKLKNIDQDIQKKIGVIEIQLSGNAGESQILKQKITELQKYNEQQRALFLDFNKKLSSSMVDGTGKQMAELSTSITVQQPPAREVQKNEENIVITSNKQKLEEPIRKTVYQVDGEGYLMDGQGKYLLTEQGEMIKLNQDQIEALIDSKAVEIIES